MDAEPLVLLPRWAGAHRAVVTHAWPALPAPAYDDAMASVDPATARPVSGVSVAVAAARLGLSTSTLRSWGTRYGLLPSLRTPGGHRRYSEEDLDLLDAVQAAVREGVAPAAAAATVMAHRGLAPAHEAPSRRRGAGPGGRVLGVPGAAPAARGLARAASQLDLDGAEGVLLQSLRATGVARTWDDVVRPVLVATGTHWAESGTGIEVEHVLSEAVLGALRRYRAELPVPMDGPPVLIASAPGDQHSLMLHALAAGLSERRRTARVIGAQVPVETLAAAARRTRPVAIFVSCVMPGAIDVAALAAAVPRTRPRTRVVVGGGGWSEVLPDGLLFAATLDDALDLLTDPEAV